MERLLERLDNTTTLMLSAYLHHPFYALAGWSNPAGCGFGNLRRTVMLRLASTCYSPRLCTIMRNPPLGRNVNNCSARTV
jgi:hypothetical protein